MRLDECYRVLELQPGASGEEVKRAYRDLTKVWHPDRFAHDAALRRKAEEKLKAINEAYETIRAARPDRPERDEPPSDAPSWRVRWRGHEARAASLQAIAMLVDAGSIGEEAEVLDPAAGRWMALTDFPELRMALTRRRVRRNRTWALTCAGIAVFVLLRRPSPAGVAIALILFVAAFVFINRMRS
jgi:curved DNA-binding protein CbpA